MTWATQPHGSGTPDTEGNKQSLLVDVHGKPLQAEPPKTNLISRTRLLQMFLESTVIIGIGTAMLFYLGSVYYQSYFGSFASPLLFPPMGTSEYLTKAFDLLATPFTFHLVVIWIVTFVVILETDEEITEVQRLLNRITEKNRLIAAYEKNLQSLSRGRHEKMQALKARDYAQYLEEVKADPELEQGYRTNWLYVWFRFFPYHISLRGIVSGLVLNLYLFLTLILIVLTVMQLDAMNDFSWLMAGTIAAVALFFSILGKSLFHLVRERMVSSLSRRLFIGFYMLMLVVYTGQFLVGSVGRHDARQFMEGRETGSYLTILDTRTARPDLEGRTFRVLIQRGGDYYLVPSEQGNIDRATLVVIPQSEIVSQTTEALESKGP